VLYLKSFTFNPFSENSYLLYADTGEAILIDPGMYHAGEDQVVFDFIEANKLTIKQIVNTHCHLDHVFGVYSAVSKYKVSFAFHELEQEIYSWAPQAAMRYGVQIGMLPPADYFIKPGDVIMVGAEQLEVLFTPGHSPGHVCFYHRQSGIVVAGDTLFLRSIGRYDLPGGHLPTLENSIRTALYTLPDATKVYSGHGPVTTIGEEKLHNPFVQPL
jgi:hydroxyacylglutathione hydrolase